MVQGRKLTPERKALLDSCVADGWPIRQMIQTHGFCTKTVKKHYPAYCGMSAVDAGKLAMAIRKANRKLGQPKISDQKIAPNGKWSRLTS